MSTTTGPGKIPSGNAPIKYDNKLLIFFGFIIAAIGQYIIAEYTPDNPPSGTILKSSPGSSLMLLLGCVVASLGTVVVLKGAPKLPSIASRTQKIMGTLFDVAIGAIVLLSAGFCVWLCVELRMAIASDSATIGELAVVGGITLGALVLFGIVLVFLYKYFYKELATIQKIAVQQSNSNSKIAPMASTLNTTLFMMIILMIARR